LETGFRCQTNAPTGGTPNAGSFAGNGGTGILPVFGKPHMGRMPMPLILTALGGTPMLPGVLSLRLQRSEMRECLPKFFLPGSAEMVFK
jgi:hypothetical protein